MTVLTRPNVLLIVTTSKCVGHQKLETHRFRAVRNKYKYKWKVCGGFTGWRGNIWCDCPTYRKGGVQVMWFGLTYQCVRYRYGSRTGFNDLSSVGIICMLKLPKHRVPVSNSYRPNPRFGYRYRICTDFTQVSGTGIKFVVGRFWRMFRGTTY